MSADNILQYRPKDGDRRWYMPERDILNLWPALVVRGAMYAADPDSSIFSWFMTQGDWRMKHDKPEDALEEALRVILIAVNRCGSVPLGALLDPKQFSWSAFQAIMCGAGIMGFNDFAEHYRNVRTANAHGRIVDPRQPIDVEQSMAKWKAKVKEMRNA